MNLFNPKGFSNIIVIVLILVAVVVIGGGVYWVVTQQAETNQNINTGNVNTTVDQNVNTSANQNANENTNTTNQNVNASANQNVNISANQNTNILTNTNSDPTANWKTYRNEKYGFEVKYPKEWRIAEDMIAEYKKRYDDPRHTYDLGDWLILTSASESEEQNFLQNIPEGPGTGLEYFARGKSIKIAPSTQSIADFKMKTQEENEVSGFHYENFQDITTPSGLKGLRYHFVKTWEGDSSYDGVLFDFSSSAKLAGSDIKGILVSIEENNGIYEKTIFENIFNTLQLTDSNNITNWKTYTNEKYGFEAKYPSSWKQVDINESAFGFLPEEIKVTDEYNGDIRIFIRSNPQKVSLKDFYNGTTAPNLYASTSGKIEAVSVDGREATRFNNVLGFITTTVIVIPYGDKFIELESSNKFPNIYEEFVEVFKFL